MTDKRIYYTLLCNINMDFAVGKSFDSNFF